MHRHCSPGIEANICRTMALCAIAVLLSPSGICRTANAQDVGPVPERRGEPGFRALYTIDRDGSNVEFLVAGPGMISSATPEWSHDGKRIAFDAVAQLQQFATSRIFVYAVDGPTKGRFEDLGHGNVPSWSPDDGRIAFMLNSGNPIGAKRGIWVMDADGANRTWLCPGMYPRWAPGGKSICIQAVTGSPRCLHLYDLESGEIRKLLGSSWTVEYSGATWSPGGKQLVFIGKHGGAQHLAVVNAGGGEETVATLYTEEDPRRKLIGPPAWSPDAERIVFAIQELDRPAANRRIWAHTYLYSLSTEFPSDPVLLENKEVGLINRGMMWSPDSQKIVFSSER